MAFQWSEAQKEALVPHKCSMLISAGAGSGKTQVLSQKVHDILCKKDKDNNLSDNINPDNILVLTFTVKAAFEMKERIKKNLKSNGVNSEIINQIDSAHIQTFDSFANYLVRKYASYLNLSESIGVLDSNILEVKLREYVDQIFEKEYQLKSPQFLNLLKKTCIKNDNDLKTIIIDIYKKMDSLIDKQEVLNNYSKYFDIDYINERYKDFLDLNKKKFQEGYDVLFSKNDVNDTNRLDKLKDFKDDLLKKSTMEEFYDYLKNTKFPEKSKGIDKEDAKVFEKFKDIVKKPIITDIESCCNFKLALERIMDSKDETLYLVSLIKILEEKMETYKKSTNSFTFNDIAKKSLDLFKNEELKQKIRDKYKFILVDEYQDTSDIQEKFIKEISNNNVYMVGDIKQSIYRFRHANCDIFRNKYNDFSKNKPEDEKGIKVDMIDNFRSRKEILDSVNEIFSSIMTLKQGGADYKIDHIINYGFKEYDALVDDQSLYGIKRLEYSQEDENFDEDREIKVVANKIIELFNKKVKVFDKDEEKLRDIKFSDIAILVRRKANFPRYQKVFSEYNIPISCCEKNSYLEYDSLLVLDSILTGINYYRNNLEDESVLKYIYASISRSYLYSLSDNQIYFNLKDGSYLNNDIFEKCKDIAEATKNMSIEDVFNRIVNNFEIVEKLYKLKDITENFDKIEYLSTLCKNFDSSNLNFDDFVHFFEKLKEYDIELEIENEGTDKDAVQLMTNHKSKGLEWPIVFLTDIYDDYNRDNEKSKGHFDKLTGIYFKQLFTDQVKSFYYPYMKLKNSFEEASETIRIFYVALTRAREILYLVYDSSHLDKFILPPYYNSLFLNLYRLSKVEHPKEIVCYDNNVYKGDNTSLNFDFANKEITPFSYEFKERRKETASHAVDENEITNDLQKILDEGIKMHEYMETIDFKNPSVTHIEDKEDREKVEKILSLEIFKECFNGKLIDAYKEYEFVDENLHGFVDLFLLFDDHIKIVDYKLSNVDKPEYKEQLGKYKCFLEKTFKKHCKTYLISLNGTFVKEITHDE